MFDDASHDGCVYPNVHVGVQCRREVVDIVPGDVPVAEWSFSISVVSNDGATDFRGPHVQGKRGDRFLYLSWGTVNDNGEFEMFRRSKLMLAAVSPEVLRGERTRQRPDRRARPDRSRRFAGVRRTEAAEDHLDRGAAPATPVTERVCARNPH